MNNTKDLPAKPIWLRLDSSEFPFQKTEALEYTLSAALISATLNLNYDLDAEKMLTASGEGDVRILFKKAQGLKVFSEGSISEENSAAFLNYFEKDQSGKLLHEWPMALDKTTREWPAAGELPAPVLNPLLILPAFASSWNKATTEYFAQLVVGSRVQALKIKAETKAGNKESRTEDGLRIYRLSLKKIPAPVVKDHWSEIAWNDDESLEFHFDEKEKVIRAFRYRISPFGSLTVSLKRVVRG